MKVKVALISFLLLSVAVEAQYSEFPLKKGNYWIYEGVVEWIPEGSGTVKQKEIKWKMEVTEMISRQQVIAAIIKGHPSDLAWYNDSTKRGNYLIISVNDKNYYLIHGEQTNEVLTRLKDKNDNLQDLVTEGDLFLSLPLIKGDLFGETSMTTRQDYSYFWIVEDTLVSGGIKQFTITFRSRPDYVSFNFAPNIGITKYKYHHNGSVSEVDLILTEKKID